MFLGNYADLYNNLPNSEEDIFGLGISSLSHATIAQTLCQSINYCGLTHLSMDGSLEIRNQKPEKYLDVQRGEIYIKKIAGIRQRSIVYNHLLVIIKDFSEPINNTIYPIVCLGLITEADKNKKSISKIRFIRTWPGAKMAQEKPDLLNKGSNYSLLINWGNYWDYLHPKVDERLIWQSEWNLWGKVGDIELPTDSFNTTAKLWGLSRKISDIEKLAIGNALLYGETFDIEDRLELD